MLPCFTGLHPEIGGPGPDRAQSCDRMRSKKTSFQFWGHETKPCLALSRGRRLLVGGNSSQVTIKRHRPVDGGSFMPGSQAVRVPAGARQGVVTPHAVRFPIQKVDGLHISRMKERQ